MKRCSCPDILHCVCDGQDKYEVKIADFDSLKKSKFSRSVVQFSEICREPMNDLDMNGVKGTPAYRAPEVSTVLLSVYLPLQNQHYTIIY